MQCMFGDAHSHPRSFAALLAVENIRIEHNYYTLPDIRETRYLDERGASCTYNEGSLATRYSHGLPPELVSESSIQA